MQTEEKCLETLYVMDLGIVILNAKTRAFIGSTFLLHDSLSIET